MSTPIVVQPESECRVSIDLGAVNNLLVTTSEHITINGQNVHKAGGWTFKDLIECAAFRINDTTGKPLASWHSHLYLEAFTQNAPDVFELFFGS
jgi:hypothetical protein